jgi:SnoaL-like domain
VWQGNLDAIVNLFAEDGIFIVKGRVREATTKGRAELRKMYEQALGESSPRPYIHNHVVDLKSSSKATGRCSVELRSAARDMEWVGTGYYDDEYVKVGESWKFASRRFKRIGVPARSAARMSKA